MKQILVKKGLGVAEKVPAPQVNADEILVQVVNSCISIGTEMAGVEASGIPIWKRALNEPEKVKKVLQKIKATGIGKTMDFIHNKLESGMPVGYSAAGIVVGVGENIKDISVGEHVSCAGAQCAHHAEIISVPRNLTVKIPQHVSFREASMATLGAIAMQGVRRALPTLGECFVVIGLGVIGQLTVQILKANGCQVIVSDIDESRVEMAMKHGADYAVIPGVSVDVQNVLQITGGIGADGVIITAASQSDEVVSTAFQMCRRKGRVVVVGAVGLGLKRADIYEKELDFFISTSYGPGRYDSIYEGKGLEYPVGYVRWTENRNLQEVLRLMAEKKIVVSDMISHVYSVDKAEIAYNAIRNLKPRPLVVLLEYPDREEKLERRVEVRANVLQKDKIQVALVGSGEFAKGVHLPNLQKLSSMYNLYAVMSRTGANAKSTARQYGATYATTDYEQVLKDPNVDLVFITTRHNLHASMALKALQAGKHVFVEKPLAIDETDLEKIESFYREKRSGPLLLTGFNRRHSKYLQEISKHTNKRINPLLINYRMNAGYIPLKHWVHSDEGAGRNIGEACHIYDLFNFLTGAKAVNISASSINPRNAYYSCKDNFIVTISYDDGSLATLTYTAMGNKEYGKEMMDIFFDNKIIHLDDYKNLEGYGIRLADIRSEKSEKGQLEELREFGKALLTGKESPIPIWQQIQAMQIAFAAERMI